MEHRQLRYFVAICQHGSFVRAARSLQVTQPALSQQIALLEREIGSKLFLRRGRSLELTGNGEKLRAQSEKLLQLWEETIHSLRDKEPLSGEYRITAGGSVATYLMPSVLLEIRRRYPSVTFRITEGDPAQCEESLLRGGADLAIVSDLTLRGSLSRRHFVRDLIVPVVSHSHPLAQQSRINLEEILDCDFIFFHPGSAIRRLVEQRLTRLKKSWRPKIVMELHSAGSVHEAVATGLGIGFLSRFAIGERLIELDVPNLQLERDFSYYYLSGRRNGVEELMDAIDRVVATQITDRIPKSTD